MTDERGGAASATGFTGTRSELFGLLFRGYLLMLPSLGVYRFWVTTAKRRFYWQHTVIDGDALEYTGNARQLLIGFLFALAFFLPIYLAFFYFSTQAGEIALLGYGAVGVVLWFLSGYAIYRARDFRLSRTLWRGIRFDQKGSAWRYALRRFFWSILVTVTLGLAYPFMAGNLWKYRYDHTWFGDRQFSFAGSWRTIAGPYYRLYFLILALGGGLVYAVTTERVSPGGFETAAVLLSLGLALVAGLGYFYFRAREATRMFSMIRIGEAAVSVRVRARALFKQFVLYCLSLTGGLVVVFGLAGMLLGMLAMGQLQADGLENLNPLHMLQSGWGAVAALIGSYLVLLACFSLMSEVFIGYGYWMLVARGASIANAESLRTVRATPEDLAVVGEGLADALNVGAY